MYYKCIMFLLLLISFDSLSDNNMEFTTLDCIPSLGFFMLKSELISVESQKDSNEQFKKIKNDYYQSFKSDSCDFPDANFSFKITKSEKFTSDYELNVEFNEKPILQKILLNKSSYYILDDRFRFEEIRGERLNLHTEDFRVSITFSYGISGLPVKIYLDLSSEAPNRDDLLVRLNHKLKNQLRNLSFDNPSTVISSDTIDDLPLPPQNIPQLWSHHKLLEETPEACSIRAINTLNTIGFNSVVRNGNYVYGNLKPNRAVIKCIELYNKTFVYSAVAGPNSESVEELRNKIAQKL